MERLAADIEGGNTGGGGNHELAIKGADDTAQECGFARAGAAGDEEIPLRAANIECGGDEDVGVGLTPSGQNGDLLQV